MIARVRHSAGFSFQGTEGFLDDSGICSANLAEAQLRLSLQQKKHEPTLGVPVWRDEQGEPPQLQQLLGDEALCFNLHLPIHGLARVSGHPRALGWTGRWMDGWAFCQEII